MTTTIDNEQKTLNVPNLRFPEFEGEWQETRLKEISKFSKERLNSIELSCSNYVTTENMLQDYKGIVSATNLPTNTNVVKFSKGDVLLSNIRPYLKKVWYADRNGGCSADVFVFKALPICDSNFLHHVIANDRFIKFVMGGSKGVKMPRGDKEQMITYKVGFPCIEEQKKIANLLSLFDERISTQNKIIEDLKKLKYAISKYLFERKDLFENKIKLSKVAELKNGYAFQSSKYNALGKWKILTIANVAGERYVKTNECNCIIEIPYDIQKHQKLEANDILISLTGNVGRVSLCTEGFFLLNQRVGLLQLKISENREFIYQVLSFHKFEESMIACAQGAAQMNIGKGDVENYILPYSFNKENINSVASVLKNYDKYIINEINMLSMLHSQKQYLLRQMFI